MIVEHLPPGDLAVVLMHLAIPERGLSAEEEQLMALVSRLIEDYESRTVEMPVFSPLERLRHLVEIHGLKQADLVDVFGSQPVVSQVLSGRRGISKAHAKRLAERFRISAAAFI